MEVKIGQVDLSDVKRVKIDITIEVPCPKCKITMICNYMDFYLTYPDPGDMKHAYFNCDSCDCEYEMPVRYMGAVATLGFRPDELEEV